MAAPDVLHEAARAGDVEMLKRCLGEGADINAIVYLEGTPLYQAAKAGQREAVEVLLASGADISRGQIGGRTPLHEAAHKGHADIVRILLAHGADPNAVDPSGDTPVQYAQIAGHANVLAAFEMAGVNVVASTETASTALWIAADSGSKDRCTQALRMGADVNASDDQGRTALHRATMNGHLAIVEQLLVSNARTDIPDNTGRTPLMWAVAEGNQSVVSALLAHGADVNYQAGARYTPLHVAVMRGFRDIAQLLLTSGAEINAREIKGLTPLHKAAECGNPGMAELLLSAGAYPDVKDKDGDAPLYVAAYCGHTDVLNVLLSQGVNVNAANSQGTTALHAAAKQGHSAVVAQLLASGADVRAKGSGGRTALHEAASGWETAVISQLLDGNADVNAPDNERRTPLHWAAKRGSADIVRVLLAHGANAKLVDNNGCAPIRNAAARNTQEVVRLLSDVMDNPRVFEQSLLFGAAERGDLAFVAKGLSQERNIELRDEAGATLLHCSATGGHVDVAELLLNAGADVNAVKRNGATALHLAAAHGHKDMVRLLLSRGADIASRNAAGRTPIQVARRVKKSLADNIQERDKYRSDEATEGGCAAMTSATEDHFYDGGYEASGLGLMDRLSAVESMLSFSEASTEKTALGRVCSTVRGLFGLRERERRQSVDCTVFAPPEVRAGNAILIQVFAHLPRHAEEVIAAAQEFDKDSQRRGVTSIGTRICVGSTLQFELAIAPLNVRDPVKEIIWQGKQASVQFAAEVPAALSPQTVIGTVYISQDTVPIGDVSFRLNVVGRESEVAATNRPCGDARRYQQAFISYASLDRPEVLRRVPMLTAVGVRFIQDILHLEPGDEWLDKIHSWIDESDVFLLFWSSNAKNSRWVTKEWQRALGRDIKNFIRPVVIEGPPIPKPPPDLDHLHFSDKTRYFLPVGSGS